MTREWWVSHPEYRKEYRKRRNIRRHQIMIDAKNRPCADCNRKYPHYCMDFDHVRGEKVEMISRIVQHRSIKQLREEIAKCDVVCAICHRMREHKRGN